MEKNEKVKRILFTCALVFIILLSILVISKIASSEDNFVGTYHSLDEKRTTVMKLMGVSAAASTAITLVPGDAGTPIAEQLADLSGYFLFIMTVICFEKWMVTIMGALAFKILIPVGCIILILAQYLAGEGWKEMGCKIILVALMLFAIVPASVVLTEKIDSSYQASIQEMIEEAEKDSNMIKDTVGDERDNNVIEKLFNNVKSGVSGTLEKFENTLNELMEAIAVLIVTSCVIPIGVLVFFLWIIKMITGVTLNLPRFRLSKILSRSD